MKKWITLCTALMLLTTSCATIITGSKQVITISTEPEGADVIVNDRTLGETPLDVSFTRNKKYEIKLEKDGYHTHQLRLVRDINAWTIGNLIFVGVIGLLIDWGTGAIYQFSPSDVHEILKPVEDIDGA